MYHSFGNNYYLYEISSDEIKLKEAEKISNEDPDFFTELICSMNSDHIKVNSLEMIDSRTKYM